MASEKIFEEKVKKFLKEQGCWILKYWAGGGYTKSGIPDLLVCCNGHFLGIELKAPNGKPSELQRYHIRQIIAARGIAFLLYPNDFEEFKTLIYVLNSLENKKLKEKEIEKWLQKSK